MFVQQRADQPKISKKHSKRWEEALKYFLAAYTSYLANFFIIFSVSSPSNILLLIKIELFYNLL